MSFNPGDVIVVNFPFSEGEDHRGEVRTKGRPALIMTVPDALSDVVVVSLSTKSHHANSVALRQSDMARGRTAVESYARADKLHVVNVRAIEQRVGAVKSEFLDRVRKVMCPALGCK